MRNLIIIFTNIIFLILLASCGGNENVDLAYKSVMGAIGEYGCSNNLETAYADLNDLSFKDASKLTVAYWGAFRRFNKKEFHDKFCECYSLTFEKDSTKATKYYQEFLDENEELVSLMHTNYMNKDLYNEGMRVLDEFFSARLAEVSAKDSLATLYDYKIIYDASSASSGWVALYDKNKHQRCYMSHADYYSIVDNIYPKKLKDEYSFLIQLGVVLKYPGANIIWGRDLIIIDWIGAQEYVNNYSSDGAKWRILSRVEASIISSHINDFYDIFLSHYPNLLVYNSSFGSINTWTSTLSEDIWINKQNGKSYNKVYTFHVFSDGGRKGEIRDDYTTFTSDILPVYPISSL